MNNVKLFGLTCFSVKLEITRPQLDVALKYLVLESDPNPTYYGRNNFPPNQEYADNMHLYLLVKNRINCFQDVILRNKDMVKESAGMDVNRNYLFPGSITFKNETYQCIRVDTVEVHKLPQLVEEIKKLGVRFIKDQKFQPYTGFVYYKRYVDYIKIKDGIYQDSIDPNRFFIHVNKRLDFDEFLKGMAQIKSRCEFHLFDVFLAEMIYRNQTHDFIGIYSKHCDRERFGELKKEIEMIFLK